MSIPRPRKGREPLNQTAGTPRTVPTATEDSPNQPARLKGDPTHGDIARRAYELFEERGGEPSREWEDWFQAERELRRAVQGT